MIKGNQTVLYQDRRFMVTTADIRTPTTYYPINETVGRVRRDILFGALAFAGLVLAAMLIYFDLWYPRELIVMGAAIFLALAIGTQISFLQLDARGFPPRIFIARAKTVRAIFNAITLARAKTAQAGGGYQPDDTESGE